jgi:predicted small metal-binding protein
MAKSIACADFDKPCSFRIIADDGQEDMMIDLTAYHAKQYHPEFKPQEPAFRDSVRSQIKSLMSQAHMSQTDIAEY